MDLVKWLSVVKKGIQGAAWWKRFEGWRRERDAKRRRDLEDAKRAAKVGLVLLATSLLYGASCKTTLVDLAEYCRERPWECGAATPPPSSTPTVAPSATVPAATPTATTVPATPSPIAGWVTRKRFANGFHGCNPYPCDPTTPKCAAGYPPRGTCRGDRTDLYEMPGHDGPFGLPKGAGCTALFPNDQPLRNRCEAFDSPGTPCGGSAACDSDHMSCPRVAVGCNGQQWDTWTPRHGSRLTWSGGVTCECDEGERVTVQAGDKEILVACAGWGFTCSAAPGSTYELCSEPWPDARTVDGRPILGGQRMCKSGFF